MTVRALLLALLCLVGSAVFAHEVRPAYLDLRQTDADTYDVLWKVPARGDDLRFGLYVELPPDCSNVSEPRGEFIGGSFVERWTVRRAGGLDGATIRIAGLSATRTDVLARLERLDGTTQVNRMTPAAPSFVVESAPSARDVAVTYLELGVEHILLGIDHLLFVFGLLLIVRTPWMLVKAITAFTVAHSITLAVATLGYVHIPAPPLNAAIALSILFLGPEIVRVWRGETSFTIRHPWIVAFAFGLLHGFGFASGLTALGLPEGDIPLALFAFNVGVEIGQLAFVALILLTVRAFKVLELHWSKAMQLAPGYVVGTLGAFWTIQRVVMMIEGG